MSEHLSPISVPKPMPDHNVTDREFRAWLIAESLFYLFAEQSNRLHELSWNTASDRARWRFFRHAEMILRRYDELKSAAQSPSDVVIRQQLAQLKARVRQASTGPIRDEAGRILVEVAR